MDESVGLNQEPRDIMLRPIKQESMYDPLEEEELNFFPLVKLEVKDEPLEDWTTEPASPSNADVMCKEEVKAEITIDEFHVAGTGEGNVRRSMTWCGVEGGSVGEQDILPGPSETDRDYRKLSSSKNTAADTRLSTCSSEKLYTCTVCLAKFTRKHRLMQHRTIHRGQKLFSCTACFAKFKQEYLLKQHLLTHKSGKTFSCTVCSAKFSYKAHLMRHLGSHNRYFYCKFCFAEFTQETDLTQHLLIHTHSKEKQLSCAFCPAKFALKDHLQQHYLLIHPDNKSYTCTVCSADFAQEASFKRHLLAHSRDKPFSCTLCSAKFQLKDHLKEHHQLVHSTGSTTGKHLSCPVCSAKFSRNSNLKEHLSVHTSEKVYPCTLCPATFTVSGYLKRHVLKHDSAVPPGTHMSQQ